MTPTLAELLPHAAPMVLLSGYEPTDVVGSISAFVDVFAASPFFDAALDGVPACVALEYMAQTMALAVGLARRARGQSPKVGFVLGSRKFETFVPVFANGARYRVSATCTYEDESFGSFDCAVTDAAGTLCARATMTAFQPEDDISPEDLKKYA